MSIPETQFSPRSFSVAPMMRYTDRHFRYLMRHIAPDAVLYTEMVTSAALMYGDVDRLLGYAPCEAPLVLQVGGDDALQLAGCARLADTWRFSAINLNCGCPSPRVQKGNFGACLMLQAPRVAQLVRAMRDACDIEVSVKHRLGVDAMDSYAELADFVGSVAQDGGVQHFIVHARKAWLEGLSPRENREVPPLRYAWVHRLKRDFPQLRIELNGGLRTPQEALTQLTHVDGVMVGRAVYDAPCEWAPGGSCDRRALVLEMIPYIERWLQQGGRLHDVFRHMLNIFHAQPKGRYWRRRLGEIAQDSTAWQRDLHVLIDEMQAARLAAAA